MIILIRVVRQNMSKNLWNFCKWLLSLSHFSWHSISIEISGNEKLRVSRKKKFTSVGNFSHIEATTPRQIGSIEQIWCFRYVCDKCDCCARWWWSNPNNPLDYSIRYEEISLQIVYNQLIFIFGFHERKKNDASCAQWRSRNKLCWSRVREWKTHGNFLIHFHRHI